MLLPRIAWRFANIHRHNATPLSRQLLTSSTQSTHKHQQQQHQQQQQQQQSPNTQQSYEQDRLTVNRTEQEGDNKHHNTQHGFVQHSAQRDTQPGHHTTHPKTHSARLYEEDEEEETQTDRKHRERSNTAAEVSSSSSPSDSDSIDFEYLLHKDPALIERVNSINISPPITPAFGIYAPNTRIAKSREEYEARKPMQRTAMGPLILTPTRDKLTPLQLQRLLALHAINPTYYHSDMLADRFQVHADIVSKIVNHVSAVRVFPMKSEEGQEELIGVADVNDLPEDQAATTEITGEHTVKHLIAWEKRQQTDTQIRR